MKKITVLFIIHLSLTITSSSESSIHQRELPASGNRRTHSAILKNEGGTLYSLALNYYQKADETLFDLIMQANPAISDVRKISGEQIIILPRIAIESYCKKLPDDTYRVHIGTFETYDLAKLNSRRLCHLGKRLFIEHRTFSSQDTWYRLTMGDFTNRDEVLEKAQDLADRGIIFIPRTTTDRVFAQAVKKPRPLSQDSSQSGPSDANKEMITSTVPDEADMPNESITILDGTIKEYYENGKVKTMKTYKQGVLEGISEEYYETGTTMFTHNYLNGKKEGLSKWYYRNGMVKYEYEYRGDVLNGMMRKYYRNGNLAASWNYRDGKKDGKTTLYNRDGSMRAEWNFKSDTLDGISRIFYDSGGIQYIDTYKADQKINRKAYDSRGKLSFEQDYPFDDYTNNR